MSDKKLECGLIMPISSIDGCTADHWSEVKNVIVESIESIDEFDFSVSLVSDADEIGVIQKRIVQNIYSSDIVVCDVSGKNPNVMFELGMRLAFDKPTVIVKDDKTDYSFDTGIIEHVGYPRDLRFSKIVSFKEKLAEKVLASYKKSENDPDHSTFLKNFGKFEVASLNEDVVSSDKMVLNILSEMQDELADVRRTVRRAGPHNHSSPPSVKIRRAIKAWAKENECSISEIVGSSSFYTFVESEIDAPSYFQGQDEFIFAVDQQLAKMVA